GLAFVKMSGQALVGEPRGRVASGREPWSMRTVMVLLAGLCLLLGLQPWLLVPWLSSALRSLRLDSAGLDASPGRLAIHSPAYHAALPVLPLLLLVGSAVTLTVLLRAWRWARRPVWVGGTAVKPNTALYSGNATSALLWEPMSRWRDSQADAPASRPAAPADGDDDSGLTFSEDLPLSPRRSVPELASYFYNRLIALIIAISNRTGDLVQNG